MTRQGVYLLVFDMHRLYQEMQEREQVELDDEGKHTCNELLSLLLWLQAVSMYTGGAPVVLVGTHADLVRNLSSDSMDEESKIPQSFYDIDHMLAETLPRRGVCKNLLWNKEEDLMFYPVDNTLSDGKGKVDPNVKRLKVVIEDAAKRDPLAYLNMTLPLSWMLALDKLLSYPDPHIPYECHCKTRHESNSSAEYSFCVRCKTATRICVECGVPLRDVEKCMHTLHERGALLFWRDNDTLRNVVVTNPKWLIEKISAVIRTRKAGSQKRRWNRQLREKFHGLSRATTKIQALYVLIFSSTPTRIFSNNNNNNNRYGLRQRRSTLSNEGAVMSVRCLNS